MWYMCEWALCKLSLYKRCWCTCTRDLKLQQDLLLCELHVCDFLCIYCAFAVLLLILLQTNIVHNQPYDESVDVSDGEEVASTNATPRGNETHPAASMWCVCLFVCSLVCVCVTVSLIPGLSRERRKRAWYPLLLHVFNHDDIPLSSYTFVYSLIFMTSLQLHVGGSC